MITSFRPSYVRLVLAGILLSAGCDGGGPSRTPDDIAADSALAADLALANRDTLLVDSIGEYRPADAAERTNLDSLSEAIPEVGDRPIDTRGSTPRSGTSNPPLPVAEPKSVPRAASPAPTPAPPVPRVTAPAVPVATRKAGVAPCNSPILADQQECVRSSLAVADRRLNRIYRALITEIRLQEGVPGGSKDPPSVQRLRVAQRAWLVYRDNECRRRGKATEGRLWARPRVRCLGQFAGRRANELADNFSRLTAR